MKKFHVSLLVLTCLLTACDIEFDMEENPRVNHYTPAPLIKDLLLSGNWKKLVYRENGMETSYFKACEMDDYIRFYNNGTYTVTDGADACPDVVHRQGMYALSADQQTMTWEPYGMGTLTFNGSKTSFTFSIRGVKSIDYVFSNK